MRKRNILIISIFIMLMLMPSSFAFTDVSNHWAKETIEKMENYKLIRGYLDHTFQPDKEMTRAEFVKVVCEMLKLEKESQKYIPDLSRQDWYYSDMRKAVEAGIIQGDLEGYVHPNSKITREEAVVILARAFHVVQNDNINKAYLDASDISDWAKEDISLFLKNGYLTGYENDTIKPKATIKRAEALTIINRMIPNFLKADVYSGMMNGNALVFDNNVALNNLVINGTLIIPSTYANTLSTKSVEVMQNVIVADSSAKTLDSIKKINVEKDIYTIYPESDVQETNYASQEYGIEFSVPKLARVVELSGDAKLNFKEKDLIVIDVEQNDDFYLKSIDTIGKEEIRKYANLFSEIEKGKLDSYEYVLYDDKENSQLIVIKRDNIVYTLIFFNIVSENLVDNVLSTVKLFPIEGYKESELKVYKSIPLSLKFMYPDIYVVVDDSYNTKNINNENGFFKLFIQVNTITDMQNYSLSEIETMLEYLAKNDGEIVEKTNSKIMNNDAIKFQIKSEEKTIYSLYVVVGNNLYNFIFTGEEMAMQEVGKSLFENIIHTLEF